MKITNVRVKKIDNPKFDSLVGYATITFDDCFVIHNIKIIKCKTTDSYFISMPSIKLKDGSFKDICHPIKTELREEITKVVVERL